MVRVERENGKIYLLDEYAGRRLSELGFPLSRLYYREAVPTYVKHFPPPSPEASWFTQPVPDIPCVSSDGHVKCINKFSYLNLEATSGLSPALTEARIALKNILPEEGVKIVEKIMEGFERVGVRAYIVGGAVRDALLKRPTRDVDILIPWMDINLLRETVKQASGSHPRINKRFGTATLTRPFGRIDFAMLREEKYPLPFALPEVMRGSLRSDILRRDYTVNALLADTSGRVYDTMGGLTHLRNRTLLTLTTVSFLEDPTRVLRGWRFEKEMNFKLSGEFEGLLKDAVKKGAFRKIEGHRITAELKLCTGDSLAHVFVKCAEHNIWGELNVEELQDENLMEKVECEKPADFSHLLHILSTHLKQSARKKLASRLKLSKKHQRILKLV